MIKKNLVYICTRMCIRLLRKKVNVFLCCMFAYVKRQQRHGGAVVLIAKVPTLTISEKG